MRRLRWLLLVSLAAAVAGCSEPSLPQRVLDVVIAQPVDAEALPVRVIDTTGLLAQVPTSPAILELDFDGRGAAANPPGQPNVLAYHWIGGACDERAELLIRIGGERRLRLELTTFTTGEGCDAIGIGRSLTLTFAQPVEDDEVRLEFVDH